MSTTITISGFTITVATMVLAIAASQFVLLSLATLFSREKLPKKGIRSADRRLAFSAGVLAVAWTSIFAANNTVTQAHTEAAVVAKAARASCSSIDEGMGFDVVEDKLGKPDEVRSDEETRGPGAKIWIYRNSRCAVHMLDDQVEFID